MATSEVITWQAASEYIEEGTVESLGKLRRSEQQLTTYRSFMDNVSRAAGPSCCCCACQQAVAAAPSHYCFCASLLCCTRQMKQEYSSVADFIKISVLERACKINAGSASGTQWVQRLALWQRPPRLTMTAPAGLAGCASCRGQEAGGRRGALHTPGRLAPQREREQNPARACNCARCMCSSSSSKH